VTAAENIWYWESTQKQKFVYCRVLTGQGKLEKSGNLCGQGKVREKYYFSKVSDHANCRYL